MSIINKLHIVMVDKLLWHKQTLERTVRREQTLRVDEVSLAALHYVLSYHTTPSQHVLFLYNFLSEWYLIRNLSLLSMFTQCSAICTLQTDTHYGCLFIWRTLGTIQNRIHTLDGNAVITHTFTPRSNLSVANITNWRCQRRLWEHVKLHTDSNLCIAIVLP